MKTMAISIILLTGWISLPAQNVQEGYGSLQVIPDPRMPADPAKNILYVPTFRASWTRLKEEFIKEDIRLNKPITMVRYLNMNPYVAGNDPDWMVQSGFVESGIIGKIDEELKTRFGTSEPDLGKYAHERSGIICYSRFRKSVTFPVPFETMKWKFTSGDATLPVECFGVTKMGESEKEKMRKQARFYDYRNPDDFILVLTGNEPGKELILAKTDFSGSMAEMIQIIDHRIRQTYPEEITELDELLIPKINLSLTHIYQELIGKFLANKGFKEYFFAEARQEISFHLDETGAVAQASGIIVKIKGPVPRIYSFDKPFLVILRDKGNAEPSLALWVATTDFLVSGKEMQ